MINSSCSGECDSGFHCPEGSISKSAIACSKTDITSAVDTNQYNSNSYDQDGYEYYCMSQSRLFQSKDTDIVPNMLMIPTELIHTDLSFQSRVDRGLTPQGYYTVSTRNGDSANLHEGNERENTESSTVTRIDVYGVKPLQCEPGYYCRYGKRHSCPAGRFGSTYGLKAPFCSGSCISGFYCPEGSVSGSPAICKGSSVFCPPGSQAPQLVSTGYYTADLTNTSLDGAEKEFKCPPGHYCVLGRLYLCAGGRWGDRWGQATPLCSGTCSAGYHCPSGSISATEVLCGDASRFCPSGSAAPLLCPAGSYTIGGDASSRHSYRIAPPGRFAIGGLLYDCPSGYYGNSFGLSSPHCSGRCALPGYYCPARSVSPTAEVCGGDQVYCPPHTSAPIPVDAGFYTADYLISACPPGRFRDWRSSQDDSIGRASVLSTHNATPDCQGCPIRTFKAVSGDEPHLCRPCDSKTSYSSPSRITCICLENSVQFDYLQFSAQQPADQHHHHFNISSGACYSIQPVDWSIANNANWSYQLPVRYAWSANISVTRYQQFECQSGHYCTAALRHQCAPGTFSSLRRRSSPCSDLCPAGYYCPPATTNGYSNPCGRADLVCPLGSAAPVQVPQGHYSNEDTSIQVRYSYQLCPPGSFCVSGERKPCPAGRYAASFGTSQPTCEDDCDAGYYCTEGSDSPRQHRCGGAEHYCVRGSDRPNRVNSGFYGIVTGIDAAAVMLRDPLNQTFSAELVCEPGYYCVGGVKAPCPPGRFGWRYGYNSSECGGKCSRGHYCPSYLLPADYPQAPAHTFWPLAPHTAAAEYQCGDVEYYCPAGTHYPITVSAGYYSIGGGQDNRTRFAQVICPEGSYCKKGVAVLCPKGRFGQSPGMSSPMCSDWCPAGTYCPPGSARPLPCLIGRYSNAGADICSNCDVGEANRCQHSRECCSQGL